MNTIYGIDLRAHTTPRERRRAQRMQDIKDEALSLVIENGVDQFSIHKLAQRLNLTPGALYRYFDSVDHLLMAIQVDVLSEFDDYLTVVLGHRTRASDTARIATMCLAYVALDRLRPERFRLIGRLVSNPSPVFSDDAAQSGMEPTMRLLGRLAALIDAAQVAGTLTQADTLDRAIIAWSSIQGLMERRKLARLSPGAFDVEHLCTQLLQTLLLGWGASTDQANEALASAPSAAEFENYMNELN